MTTTGPSVLFMVWIYLKIYPAFTFWITEIEQVSRRWASSPWYWVRTWCRKGELPNTVTTTKKSWRYFLSLVNYQLFVEPQSCGNHCWMTHKIKYRTHERKERDKNFVSMKTFVNEIMQHSEKFTSLELKLIKLQYWYTSGIIQYVQFFLNFWTFKWWREINYISICCVYCMVVCLSLCLSFHATSLVWSLFFLPLTQFNTFFTLGVPLGKGRAETLYQVSRSKIKGHCRLKCKILLQNIYLPPWPNLAHTY